VICWNTSVLLGGELPLGHEIGLIVVAAVFIAFALAASLLVPRYKPDFPGPNGLSVFAIASIVMFVLMLAAINFFG
jgi:hypothetical protein